MLGECRMSSPVEVDINKGVINMTPRELARKECANYQPDGSCLGIQPEGLLDPRKPVFPHRKCLLAQKPMKPCLYFERCLLPLVDQPESIGGKVDGITRVQWQDARRRYLSARRQEVPEVHQRQCPDCDAPLAKRQRICAKCQKKRRRESNRKAQERKRKNRCMPVSS